MNTNKGCMHFAKFINFKDKDISRISGVKAKFKTSYFCALIMKIKDS